MIAMSLRSYIEYSDDCDFPIENLPYGVFSTIDDVRTVNYIMIINASIAGNCDFYEEV